MEFVGNTIASTSMFDHLVRTSDKPIAVMFETLTCPVCKKMRPYWAKLEEASDRLPIAFYHVVYGSETAELFTRYGVTETPTFIVFVNGEPVARWVGGFEGPNITAAMLSWAMGAVGLAYVSEPEKLASEGLEVFNAKCSACHGVLEGIDAESARAWLEAGLARGDLLARRLSEALGQGLTASEAYGSYDVLLDVVASMRRYVDLTSYEVDRAAYLLEYVSSILAGREPPRFVLNATLPPVERSGEATPLSGRTGIGVLAAPLSIAAAVAVGAAAALSPCVLPVLASYAAVLGRTRGLRVSDCGVCALASFAGVFAVGAAFALAGTLVSAVQELLIPVVAAAVTALGFALLAGASFEFTVARGTRRTGFIGFCALYGFLTVQCNLPMVAGALLLMLGLGGVDALAAALGFALGVSAALAVAVYAASKLGAKAVEKITARSRLVTAVGGAILVASGIYLLAYALGVAG